MKIPFSKLPPSPRFTVELNADPEKENFTRQVKQAHFSFVTTEKPSQPEWVHTSSALLEELNLPELDETDLAILSGVKPFPRFDAYAMCYGGHQFGHWAGQLGDGRAINILETVLNDEHWTFQLKGAGATPYSRSADGKAVLRSSIREYLCSEAMHQLGVPTTRALSLVKTGDWITRDILYNGNKADEPGAIVCRVSPSFVRFGNFEIFSARGEEAELKQLVDYILRHHFPALGQPSKETYIAFFETVTRLTKEMILHWQRVGFVHGVMNTDNLSILGLTIDYGPYGWLENYDPAWTPNTTDRENRRYRFENQPNIALWNLVQLANALFPLIQEAKPLEDILENFKTAYTFDYHKMMCAKLGLHQNDRIPETFIEQLLALLEHSEMDMTLFFRELSTQVFVDFDSFYTKIEWTSYAENFQDHVDDWKDWFHPYLKYLNDEKMPEADRLTRMKALNPKYVLRNYMAQLAIEAAENDNFELVHELYDLVQKPYDEQPEMEKWYAKRPDWAKNKVGSSMLSCSS